MIDEMVRRVGRAIWLKLSGPELDECEEAARAAIEAMRLPTQAMVNAAPEDLWNDEIIVQTWSAMIDAALGKPPA